MNPLTVEQLQDAANSVRELNTDEIAQIEKRLASVVVEEGYPGANLWGAIDDGTRFDFGSVREGVEAAAEERRTLLRNALIGDAARRAKLEHLHHAAAERDTLRDSYRREFDTRQFYQSRYEPLAHLAKAALVWLGVPLDDARGEGEKLGQSLCLHAHQQHVALSTATTQARTLELRFAALRGAVDAARYTIESTALIYQRNAKQALNDTIRESSQRVADQLLAVLAETPTPVLVPTPSLRGAVQRALEALRIAHEQLRPGVHDAAIVLSARDQEALFALLKSWETP